LSGSIGKEHARSPYLLKGMPKNGKSISRNLPSDADEQAERFITLLDDLAYSRTFYPQSKVTRWINNIAASIYQKIYRNKKEQYHRFIYFLDHELPLVLYRHRMAFGYLPVFCPSMVMGIYSSATDDSFVKSILGESYVSMTEENIEKGDPFGVYRDEDKFTMFMMIAANNIRWHSGLLHLGYFLASAPCGFCFTTV
jgi:hypothetical protein